MNFTRNYTTENMFRDYLGVHANTFQVSPSMDNESHSTEHTQKTKGGSVMDNLNVVGGHRGKSSPQKTQFYDESKVHRKPPPQKQQQQQQSQPPPRPQSPPKQSQQQSPIQPAKPQSPQRGNSIQERTPIARPQHPKRSASAPQYAKRAGSFIGAQTLKFIGCFDGVCDSVSDWWGENCSVDSRERQERDQRRSRGRSRTSRRERDPDYYKDLFATDDDTYGTYSDGTYSGEDDSLSFNEDGTYDLYDDDYLARDLQRQRKKEDEDDGSLSSLERQRKWKQAKEAAIANVEYDPNEPAIVRQRRIRMEQERWAIEEQRERFHSGRAMSFTSQEGRKTTVSTAHTEVIQNTLARRILQQQGGETRYHSVHGGTEWPEDQGETKKQETSSSAHEPVVNGDSDEAQRAFDWIHDPKQREEAWLKANSDSNSIKSGQSRRSKSSQDAGSLRSVPLEDEDASRSKSPQHWSAQKRSPETITRSFSPDHKPSQHWKKLDDKVQAERIQLQSKHEQEALALERKKQEQDALLHQRLSYLAGSGEHSMNLDLSAIPTTDGSDHAHETYVLQLEQEKETHKKEQELEILQGAIHQRLAQSPSALERREKLLAASKEVDSFQTQLDKEKEWLEAFKKRQAEIAKQDELIKKQLEETLLASNHRPKVPSVDDASSLKSNGSSKTGSSEKRAGVVKFATKQQDEAVPPLPPSLETFEAPPPAKSPEEHKQQITSSFDSDDQGSLEPNPRSKPIQCKVELPAIPAIDPEKERRMAEQKRAREEFKASRLKALAERASGATSPSNHDSSDKDPVQAMVDGDAKSKDGSSQDSASSNPLQTNELTLGSQSFSNMDDISVLTPASTKTMETTQTTQTAASKKSSVSLPPTLGNTSSSKGSARTPVMPPTIQQLQKGKKRGESPRLSAKRKELEWMWNAAKKPLQQLEEEQRAKQKKMNRVKKLVVPPGGLEESSVGSSSTKSSSKRVLEYAPGVTPVDRMPNKVWTKKKGGSVATATTASSNSSEGLESRRDLLLDKPPKKNRVSQLVQKQREFAERHHRNGRHSPCISVVPEESDVPSVVTNTEESKPDFSFASSQGTPISGAPSDEMEVSARIVTPEKEEQQVVAPSPRVAVSTPTKVVTPDSNKKRNSPRVMNFWEQKEQEQLAKQAQQEQNQKRESWNQKKSPPTATTGIAPKPTEPPLSKIELKRRELAAKREAFQKRREEAAKRLEQELVVAPSESNLDESMEEEKNQIETKELIGKFEELKVVLSSTPEAPFRRPPPHRCLADRKQQELERRNEEYLNSLSQFGRSKSHETNSTTAWPEAEPPRRHLVSKSRYLNDYDEDAQSNKSVPEKEITPNQQLRQAWRQRAWKTLDNKVDRDGFPSMEPQLGAKAVQKVLKNSTHWAMLTEHY